MLEIKPTHKPIKEYFDELERILAHGHDNEMSVRNAFQDLLQTLSKKVQWQFIEEYAIKRKGRRDASVDGALLDQFSLARAFWEAKDTKDDLASEVQKKFADGYPTSNILFWQPGRAILVQEGRTILDADISRRDVLVEVLQAFFNFDLPYIKEWEHAVDEFKEKIPTLAAGVLKILAEQRTQNRAFRDSFNQFVKLSQSSINPDLSVEAVEEMLIQHILTRRIFRTIFKSEGFLQKNAVARELEGVVANLVQGYGTVDQFLKPLDRFYVALERAADATDDYAQKQTFLNTVYEKFFQGFAVKVADTHGIVYTPQPIVDFMVRSVEAALQKDFGKSLANEGVHILDPFVGTGNFILRVMREIHELRPQALRHKYLHELHCNEVMLLPYYIACLNIEHLYMELTGEYLPFPGICLVDTFELVEDRQLGMFTSDNTERVKLQKEAPIYVVIGNPPYNAGQVHENDNNKNRTYPAIDRRVAETYARDSQASNKNALSDPYVKAFRMAADRVLSRGEGIVCLVTNSGFLDGIAFDGMRRHLRRDFDRISIIDLGGNVRKNPKLSGTTHNVFGIQVGACIALMEHHADKNDGVILYARMDEFWRRTEKYRELTRWGDVSNVGFTDVPDNPRNLWLTDGMAEDWESLLPLGSFALRSTDTLFEVNSCGYVTARDSWIVGHNHEQVASNVAKLLLTYNHCAVASSFQDVTYNNVDETTIKWTDRLKQSASSGVVVNLESDRIVDSYYRPYTKQYLYFDNLLVQRRYQLPRIYGEYATKHPLTIAVSGIGSSKPFQTVASAIPICFDALEKSQCYPISIIDAHGQPKDNITNWGLEQFTKHYNDGTITKLDTCTASCTILPTEPSMQPTLNANSRASRLQTTSAR